MKCSCNFFTIKIINNISPWNCIFNFINDKTFFRPIWCASFCKDIFVLRNSYMIPNNISATTDFSLLCIEYISTSLSFKRIIVKFTSFVNPYFVWFSIRFFQYFLKSISNCNTFFIFYRNNPCIFTKQINCTQ